MAAENQNMRMFKMLLGFGANLTLTNSSIAGFLGNQSQTMRGKTPLDYLLLMQNSDIDIRHYVQILTLQGLIPDSRFTFESYKQIVDDFLGESLTYYSILTYFVSEFIYV